MTSFLTFTIYAPLASWGEVAVGEVRDSLDRPTRSAVLGLLAACLGINREAQDKHDALDNGYGLAVHALRVGRPMEDYHTTQSVARAAVKKMKPVTRRELLMAVGSSERETILSTRTLRQDALIRIVIWQLEDAPWSLDELKDALNSPVYVPYAGRKSNPFGLPFDARVVDSETLSDVLKDELSERGPVLARFGLVNDKTISEVWHDDAPDAMLGLDRDRVVVRRDRPVSRTRWQFAERNWIVSRLSEGAP